MAQPRRDPTTGRILDANLNRGAEALRVVEDVCRFHWEAPGFSRDLKELRHELLGLLSPDASARIRLLEYRDIEGDPGRDIPSPSSPAAAAGSGSLDTVAVRNLERAKEALRTLEEICRVHTPDVAASVERLRYRLYSIEKGLLGLATRHRGVTGARLYLLWSSDLTTGPPEEVLRGALDGGVDAVQLRQKRQADRDTLRIGRRVREITARAGVPFLVNDRPDLARLLDADGVHLGQDDLPLAAARELIGDRIVGISTHSLEQARKAEREGADYVGVGPVYPTATKESAGPALGPRTCGDIVAELSVPAFAIGGLRADNLEALSSAGVSRIAVSAAILGSSSAAESRQRTEEVLAVLGPAERSMRDD